MQYPKLVESKTSAHDVINIEWNPGMDLLATVFNNGTLTCSRLLSLQKVWHKQSNGKIISIGWRPDGRVLLIGAYNDKTKENICTLHDVENGKEIFSITKTRTIASVAWFQYTPTADQVKDQEDIMRMRKVTQSVNPNENFSHQLAHEQTQLNMLMISTDDGKISFYALGLFYLGDLNVYNDSNSRILKTHMSSCMRYISSVISTKHSNYTTCSVKVLKLETFHQRSNEILRVSKMYAKITDELEYLYDTISAITTSWADVLAGLDNKLSSYCSRKNKNLNDSRSGGYTFLSADELMQLLVIGFPSNNLEKFLTDMSDKGLKKLNNEIEQTCLRVQNLIVNNAQKCCYHLHRDLNLLRGMSLWRERFQDVGLDDKCITDAMRSVGSLMLKITELNKVIDHSLKSTKSFFRWLISIACRMTEEHNNSTVPNDMNKMTQQDIQQITDFIVDNFDYNSRREISSQLSKEDANPETEEIYSNRPTCSNFTLEQVGQYMKNEPLTRLKHSFTKANSNFWIEFFEQRPELTETKCLDDDGSSVLLFYPHNAELSLIQQHKKTCEYIENAFKSVATNIKLKLKANDNFINLKDFIRNAPANRIRIETDVKMMQHYTLFQTKPNQVQKQYLLSQSLQDKSFKLMSIEFQTINTSAREQQVIASTSRSSTSVSQAILITDSGFYENKETKRLLLSFLLLDTSDESTIIVHVDLNKVQNNPNVVEKSSKDLVKVIRSNDSIDRLSSQVILRLDLYVEPAYERNHKPEMMVKKIKNTIGRDMFSSSGRGVIAFTSCENKRIHLYELESSAGGLEIMDDEVEGDEKIDESLIDTELIS